ncbi:MAG: APH(3') family aminoglycoside O-phosphotransferase [Spirosomataceae bacterium]
MDKEDVKTLLDTYFRNYTLEPMLGGGTDAKLFSINTKNGNDFVVKIQPQSLRNEYLNYQFLAGKVPVPRVQFYASWQNHDVLCMIKIKGQTLDSQIHHANPSDIVRQYARALKLLHTIPIQNAPIRQTIQEKVVEAGIRIKEHLVDIEDFQKENRDMSSEDLYKKLVTNIPQNTELVFTHGDYCLDNILFDASGLTGFIDMGRGGVADKYQDIALAVRSIRDEFSEDFLPLFFEEYGISAVSYDKIDFYILLDEFF